MRPSKGSRGETHCRNGNLLAEHGEWKQSASRPMHVRCRECRKNIKRKWDAMRRKNAVAA